MSDISARRFPSGRVLVAVLVVALAAGLSFIQRTSSATPPAALVVRAPSVPALPQVTLWEQYNGISPTENGVNSQNYEAANDVYDDWAGDDFVVPSGQQWVITALQIRGSYGGTGSNATTANVLVYASCSGLPCGTPGQFNNQPFTGGPNDFTVTFSPPITTNVSGTLWVAVQPNLDNGSGNRQWFWTNRTTSYNFGAVWANPGNGFATGCTGWTRRSGNCLFDPGEPDQVFRVLGSVRQGLRLRLRRRLRRHLPHHRHLRRPQRLLRPLAFTRSSAGDRASHGHLGYSSFG